jgi:glycosyltransferase involved in cell wall biosynthesis
MSILISVIVPVYNSEKTIRKCVESIINQTYKNLEIILVDDYSTDNSVVEISKIKDSRIKIIKQSQNSGVGASRNIGLKNAKGRYIGFVDSDDFIASDFYEVLLNNALLTNADIVETDVNFLSASGKILKSSKKNVVLETFQKKIKFLELSPCWNKLYKASLIHKHNLIFQESLNIGEDILFVIKAIYLSGILSYTNNTAYNYTYNQNSLTKNSLNNEKRAFERNIALKLAIDFVEKDIALQNDRDIAKKFFYNHYISAKELLKYKKYRDVVIDIIGIKALIGYIINKFIKIITTINFARK